MPKGRFATATPKITIETERDAVRALTPNSCSITGSTGCVM